jgi:4-hydroxy-2-oxoheptanedioate aldolase
MRPNRVRRKLLAGEPVFGINLQFDSPWLVEMIGQAGFDFVMLDMEHGFARMNLPVLILAADAAGITPIVRVANFSRADLLNALEFGAGGIQVPMVDTPEQAQALVRETKYAPLGERGFSSVTRAADYGRASLAEFAAAANRETLLIIQLETRQALDNAASIASVEGIDMIFFGPGDLSQSFGLFGQEGSATVREAIVGAIRAVGRRVPVSTSAFSAEDIRFWKEHSVSMFLTSSVIPIRKALDAIQRDLTAGMTASESIPPD